MNKTILALTVAALVSPMAFADDMGDAGHKDQAKIETSHNPITGSDTVTETHEQGVKKGKAHAKVKTVKKTKHKKDGTVEQSINVDGDSANK